MASSATSLSSENDVEQQGVNFAVQDIRRENVTLKEMQFLRIVIVEKKNSLAVLQTGFVKSLVYQLMAPFADFMDSGFRPRATNSIVLVVSPLNALIRDQVSKLREWFQSLYSLILIWLTYKNISQKTIIHLDKPVSYELPYNSEDSLSSSFLSL